MTYATVDELKSELGLSSGDDRIDSALADTLSAAHQAVDAFCGRSFDAGDAGVQRTIDTGGNGLAFLDDLIACETVECESGDDWTPVAATSLVLLPRNAVVDGRPYTMLRYRSGAALPDVLRVTGSWGWPEVPDAIKRATILQAIRLHKSKDVPLGVVGGADMMGTMRLAAGLHPDAALLAGPYQRITVA